ncbi:hypothetical protein FO519_002688 [Halicephalobus sp. NKZ332]|nr:hypothetical protein FO519_002688 [Halicephalobus sp. NKZ332]
MKSLLVFTFLISLTMSRVLDKNYYSAIVPGKIFDYYDIAKGNIPSSLVSSDKAPETFFEDEESVKSNDPEDFRKAIENEEAIPVAPEEKAPETLKEYDDYAEESVQKPLETPVIISVDEKPNQDQDGNSTEIVPNVEDEMILVTLKPLWISFQWIVGAFCTYIFLTGGTIILIWAESGLMILSGILLVITHRLNNIRYRECTTFGKTYNLTERYQLAENLRSLNLLSTISYAVIAVNIVCLAAFMIMHFGSGNFLQVLLKAVFDYTVATYSYAYPLLGVLSNPPLKAQYLAFLKKYKSKIGPAKSPRSDPTPDSRTKLVNLKTSKGLPMVFSMDQEKNIYFQRLGEIWSTHIPVERDGTRRDKTANKYIV